ncbi:hypothetical protein K501DRAFT_329308 [Backusella circina FSU 941]|nr:hypothetical protein K501DRAFT_329308 [Backusella circina FSU 941]
MSVLLLNSSETTRLMTVGTSHSYCFYQQLNVTPAHNNSLRTSRKQIIPSVPRKHFKPPPNSSLSPIRSQKIMPKKNDSVIPKEKRPYPLLTTFSSPASIQTEPKTTKKSNSRRRKVSFDEKVVVICTIFDAEEEEQQHQDDSEEEEEVEVRRHSTGEIKPTVFIDPSTKSLRKSLSYVNNVIFPSKGREGRYSH